MTPYEFYLYCEGVTDRREDEYSMLAWLQANIMTMWMPKNKSVKASQLFKRRDAAPEFTSAEEFKAKMRAQAGND